MAQIDKKPTVDAPSFEEQMRQSEQEAGIPPDAELYAEWGVENPPVDEQGRVAVSRPQEGAETPPEPVQEELPVEAEGDPGDEQPEEPEPIAAEAEAPDPMVELNKKLGDLLNDNAELRRQLQQQQAEPVAQQPQFQPLTDVGWFDEFAEGDPANAATWALQNQQTHLYDRAVRAWYDQDPVAAGRFERQVENAMLQQNIQQAIQPQVQQAQEFANRSKLEQGMAAVAARHDDFGEVMGTLNEESVQRLIAAGLPVAILEQGLQGDPQQVEGTFETLYRFQKAEVAGHLVKAAQETPARVNEEAREAKREAFVGSAATTTPDEVPETEAERMARAWKEDDRSLASGWVGRDSRQRLGR